MKKLPDEVIHFFQEQGFTIVATVNKDGSLHSSCKGIVKIDAKGTIYLLDLYRKKTYENLRQNPQISITAVNEHQFIGFCLRGKAKIVSDKDLAHEIIKAWEARLTTRITQRVIRNIQGKKGHARQPEALLPKPEYLIAVEVGDIVDLTPHHLK